MNTLRTEYKFDVGEKVYFMYDNEIRVGVVHHINISISSRKILDGSITAQIANGILNILGENKFQTQINYELDLMRKDKDQYYFAGTPHHRKEWEIFKTQEDLIHSLSIK